ncbi:Rv3235 family protein [Umezawaea sp.]|uniref:Rv3235 family protein n=1 Tax=Umezawaea sp. TaxID=1955258 RepID=UPI0039C9ADC3
MGTRYLRQITRSTGVDVPSQLRTLGSLQPPPRANTEIPAMRTAPERRLTEEDARRILTFVAEALDGRRAPRQLIGLMDEKAARELPVETGRVRLGRIRLCRVAPTAAEISGTLTRNNRVHALVARLEHTGGHWTCTVFKVIK